MSTFCETQRTPESFESAKLLSLDFDGTTHLTSEAAPGIKTVDDGYALALDADQGWQAADTFLKQGGHNHRTPAEIVNDVFPDMDEREVQDTARRIIHLKKEVLIGQIGARLPDGARWPRLTDGFQILWEELHRIRPRGGVLLDTMVLSAGHTDFIAKAFALHGLAQPDYCVTDDVLNEFGLESMPPAYRAKPSPLPLAIGKMLWGTSYGRMVQESGLVEGMKERILHVGDSLEKDGGLALSSNVAFIHLLPEHAKAAWRQAAVWAGLGSLSLKESV